MWHEGAIAHPPSNSLVQPLLELRCLIALPNSPKKDSLGLNALPPLVIGTKSKKKKKQKNKKQKNKKQKKTLKVGKMQMIR